MDWKEFDKQVDLDGLKADVENNTGGEYKEVPTGNYEVAITKLELAETKETKNPMVKAWFKIVSDGEHKGSLIFMNQAVSKGFQIHMMNEFLRSLESGVDIDFESYAQYAQLLMDVFEAVNGNFEYALKYGKTEKGFNTFEITEVFELEK